MFKNKKRIVPVLVAVVIALFSSTIGAFAAGNPYVTIVNPIQNSKIEGNSFLVSVKIAKAERLKIEVYEAKVLLFFLFVLYLFLLQIQVI